MPDRRAGLMPPKAGSTGTVTGRCPPEGPEPRSGAGTASQRESCLRLAPLATAAGCARLHAVHVLHEWGLRHLAEDAALVVSELITNAADASIVVPGHPAIALRLRLTGTSLIVEAWDQSPLDLEPRDADGDDECGRGLTVVAALSDRWGWQRTSGRRKVVWAECTL